MAKKNSPEKNKYSGLNPKINRRDFIGNTLKGSGAALLGANASGALAQTPPKPDDFKLGKTMPLPLNDLDTEWDGPSGVGDYAGANGNTHNMVNMAHTFRNGDLAGRVKNASNTREEYDLVCVGGGFAGVSAAYYYLKENPDAKILICDNHGMFGGEARHNEYEVDGHKLWAPQGSTGAVWPLEWAKKIEMYSPLWEELRLPTEFTWQEPKDSKLRIPWDNYSPMHISWEHADLGWYVEGQEMAVNPWSNRFKDVAISEKTKNDLIWMEVYRQPPERDDWMQWLDSMTYRDFIRNEMGIINQEVENYLNPFMAAMGCGMGCDVVSALQAFNFISPGVTQYNRYHDVGDPTDFLHLAQFPGGNTGILRHIVHRIMPGIFGNAKTISEIISNPVDWKMMDNADMPVRMRLNALVVNVEHNGAPSRAKNVDVTYLKNGEMHRVRAKQVVMAGQQHVNKRVVSDLPGDHKAAMDTFMHSPMLIINVVLRNWEFMEKMGVSAVRWLNDDNVGGWFTTLNRSMIMDGKEPMPLSPDKPRVLTLYNSFCMPDIPLHEQTVAARMRMFNLSYEQIEKGVKDQFTKMFKAGGFNADRDIAEITTNRQGHAYVVTPPGFFFGKDDKPAPSDVIRESHGRVNFAHAELKGYQMWEGASHEAERAAHQALEKS